MTKRVIHVGVGSFGRRWLSEFLAANIADKTIEVVAIVDVDEKALAFGREPARPARLRLPQRRGGGVRRPSRRFLHGRRAARTGTRR